MDATILRLVCFFGIYCVCFLGSSLRYYESLRWSVCTTLSSREHGIYIFSISATIIPFIYLFHFSVHLCFLNIDMVLYCNGAVKDGSKASASLMYAILTLREFTCSSPPYLHSSLPAPTNGTCLPPSPLFNHLYCRHDDILNHRSSTLLVPWSFGPLQLWCLLDY